MSEPSRELLNQVVRNSMFAVDDAILDPVNYAQFQMLTSAQQSRYIVECALGFLLHKGIVSIKPEEEWPTWLSVDGWRNGPLAPRISEDPS